MKYKVYRGQYGSISNDLESKLPSITFCDLSSAIQYALKPNDINDNIQEPKIILANVTINNPVIESQDCFADFGPLLKKLDANFIWKMAEKHSKEIYITDNWVNNYLQYKNIRALKSVNPKAIYDLYLNAYVLLDDAEFINQAIVMGYDGAMHIGNGLTYDKMEYRVFNKEQVEILNILKLDDSLLSTLGLKYTKDSINCYKFSIDSASKTIEEKLLKIFEERLLTKTPIKEIKIFK